MPSRSKRLQQTDLSSCSIYNKKLNSLLTVWTEVCLRMVHLELFLQKHFCLAKWGQDCCRLPGHRTQILPANEVPQMFWRLFFALAPLEEKKKRVNQIYSTTPDTIWKPASEHTIYAVQQTLQVQRPSEPKNDCRLRVSKYLRKRRTIGGLTTDKCCISNFNRLNADESLPAANGGGKNKVKLERKKQRRLQRRIYQTYHDLRHFNNAKIYIQLLRSKYRKLIFLQPTTAQRVFERIFLLAQFGSSYRCCIQCSSDWKW